MEVVKFIERIKSFFTNILNMECRILSIVKTDDGWKGTVEVLVDEEYTRRRGLGDIVEIFEVFLSESGEIAGYELKATKRRASLE